MQEEIAAIHKSSSQSTSDHSSFGAMLIPIAKKYGGIIRPIVIGTIFHKFISSVTMCNLKEKEAPWHILPCAVLSGMPGGAERT